MAAVVIAPTDRCAPFPATAPSPRPRLHVPTPAGAASTAHRPARLPETVYWRRRVLVILIVSMLLAFIALAAMQAIGAVAPPSSTPSGEVDSTARPSGPAPSDYVVEPGDTLWSIAVRIAPGQDPRPIVHRLAERSGGTALRPGQRLSLAGIR